MMSQTTVWMVSCWWRWWGCSADSAWQAAANYGAYNGTQTKDPVVLSALIHCRLYSGVQQAAMRVFYPELCGWMVPVDYSWRFLVFCYSYSCVDATSDSDDAIFYSD